VEGEACSEKKIERWEKRQGRGCVVRVTEKTLVQLYPKNSAA
jgi:hypothetical protein